MNNKERLVELFWKIKYTPFPGTTLEATLGNQFTEYALNSIVDDLIANGVTIPVRCKDCKYHYWEQEPCHGKTEHFCSVLKAQVFADFYCYHGQRKENGDE